MGPTNQIKLVPPPVNPAPSVYTVSLTCGAVLWQVYCETGWIENRWVVVDVEDSDCEWNAAV